MEARSLNALAAGIAAAIFLGLSAGNALASHHDGYATSIMPVKAQAIDASGIPGFLSGYYQRRSDSRNGLSATVRQASAGTLQAPRRQKCYMIFGRLTCAPLASSPLATDAG